MVVMNSTTSGASQAYKISTAKEMNNLKENEEVKKIMENVDWKAAATSVL